MRAVIGLLAGFKMLFPALLQPFLMPLMIVGLVGGLLGYVHHDGHKKGYAKHAREVAAAIERTNVKIEAANVAAQVSIASAEEERDAAVKLANSLAGQIENGQCRVPESLRQAINKISRR